jgi:hypothetical protein
MNNPEKRPTQSTHEKKNKNTTQHVLYTTRHNKHNTMRLIFIMWAHCKQQSTKRCNLTHDPDSDPTRVWFYSFGVRVLKKRSQIPCIVCPLDHYVVCAFGHCIVCPFGHYVVCPIGHCIVCPFGYCVFCPFPNYGFWLPLWCLQYCL